MSYFSIRARLIFLAILLLSILAAAMALLTRELVRDSAALSDEAQFVAVVRSANNANQHFNDLKYWLNDFVTTVSDAALHNADAAKSQLATDLRAIAPVDPQGVAAVERDLTTLWELMQKASEAYYTNDDSAGGSALIAQAQPHIVSVNNEVEEIVNRVEQLALSRRDAAILGAKRAVDLSIGGGIIALALAIIVTALVVRSINAPLRRLERSMTAITEGQLDVAIPTAGRDEIGGMTRALTMLRDSLIERRRLEQQRQQAEAQARRAQNSARRSDRGYF